MGQPMSAPTAKPGLMKLDLGRDHQRYPLEDGSFAPGVTSVLGDTCVKHQLINWANDEGLAGRDIRKTVRRAADLGTIVHSRIEAYVRGYDGLDPAGLPQDLLEQSDAGFGRFLEWWHEAEYRVVGSEVQLVSESLRVGGTLDLLVMDRNGGLIVADIKTSKAIYRDHCIQACAYRMLWNEKNDPAGKVLIWRTGKSQDDPGEIHEVTNVVECENAFRTAVTHFYALRKLA